MENRPSLIVRTRYLPQLLFMLPGYATIILFAAVVAQLYYRDVASTLRAVMSITFCFIIHAFLAWLQRPSLRFLGPKLYIRCRWGDEQELVNLRASDFILTQTPAEKRCNTGSLQVKDVSLHAFAAKGGVNCLHGVEDFDQVCSYVQSHFPA